MSDSSAHTGNSVQIRLFPLPNLVFFPNLMQPLHIFEPRYRQMTADALAADRLITMVLPRPGWEQDYAGKPALYQVGCVGRILAEQRLDDGRFNILLRGQARVRLLHEIPTDRLYRTACGEILHETPIASPQRERSWRKTLKRKTAGWFAQQDEVARQFRKLLHDDLPLGALCDIIAFALPLEPDFKQALLEELDVETRLQLLQDMLDGKIGAAQSSALTFPPEFSVN